MSVISLDKIQQVLPEFVDARLIPSAPSNIKWLIGGATFLILHKANDLIAKYLPLGKTLGLITDDNKLDVDSAKGFLNTAFSKSNKITLYNEIILDKADGEFLISLLEKYKDD